MEKVCASCHRVVNSNVCPLCKTSTFSKDWTGYLIVLNPEKSEIAKKMGIKYPGRYALKVR